MDGKELGAGVLEHLGVLEAALVVVKHPHLGGDRHVALRVRRVHELVDEPQVVHEERPVLPLFGNPLGAAQVEVDGIALALDHACRRRENVGVVGAKLRGPQRQRGPPPRQVVSWSVVTSDV